MSPVPRIHLETIGTRILVRERGKSTAGKTDTIVRRFDGVYRTTHGR